MNKKEVELAVGTGLQIFGAESSLDIPVRHNDGVFYLKQLLTSLATGQYALAPTHPPAKGKQERKEPPKDD